MVLIARDKCFADLFPPFRPHRDILQVGIIAGEPARNGNGLSVGGMHPAGFGIDQLGQRIHVSRFQLGQFAESKDVFDDRTLVGQFEQYIFPGGILACLGFFGFRVQFEFFKKNFAKLLGRREIEADACLPVNIFFRHFCLLFQFNGIILQKTLIYLHPFEFHIRQHLNERVLHFIKQPFHFFLFQFGKEFPGITKYMEETVNFAKEKGYVQTLMGRKRWLRDINSANFTVRGFAERNAINSPIQGTAADMIKMAMVKIHGEMKKKVFRSRMIMQVHDELVFDAMKEEAEDLKALVLEGMRSALPLPNDVPVIAEAGIGTNWLEAH